MRRASLFVAAALAACGSGTEPVTGDAPPLLTAHAWSVTSVSAGAEDLLGAQIVFTPGGTGSVNTITQNGALAWRVDNGGRRLITNAEGLVDTSTIVELSSSILRLQITDARMAGATLTLQAIGNLDVLAAFDSVWARFDRVYPYFTYKQIDWRALRDKYRPRAAAASSMEALAGVLSDMLLPLRDVHVHLRAPDGSIVYPYPPQLPMNWDRAAWQSYIVRANSYHGAGVFGYGRFADIGYMIITSWDAAQIDPAAVDAALDQLRDTRAMIIDVRMNGGGSDAPARQVAERFATDAVIGTYYQMRSGPNYTDLTPMSASYVTPRGPWTYTKPVYVLVGRGVFSANETFTSMMHALPQVKLVGDTTGGGMGNAVSVILTNGWTYTAPSMITLTANREMIEWRGIAPDIYVPATATDFSNGLDPVLDFAIANVGRVGGWTSGRMDVPKTTRHPSTRPSVYTSNRPLTLFDRSSP